MINSEEKIDSLLNKFIDFIFSKDERRWLIIVFFLGLFLRIAVASDVSPVADEMVHGVHAIGVSKLAPLSTMTQGPVWFYLTDYGYRLFGISLLTSRLLSVIFGSLSIILVYLIASNIFNKKVGLISSFLLAVSAFHITWSSSYQDQSMMFFILIAAYLFIKEYRTNGKISLFAAIFLAIAELIKIITGVFIIIFGLFILSILIKDFKSDKARFKLNLIRTILFLLILLVGFMPVLVYNLFLYKSKGIVDLPFAQFLRINAEFYTGPGLHHGEGFVLNKLLKNLNSVFASYLLKEDLLISLIGLLGIIFLLGKVRKTKEKRFEILFLISLFIFCLTFIASAIVLQTHYTSFFPLLAIFGGVLIYSIKNKFKKYHMHFVLVVLISILLFNLYHLQGSITSQSGVQKTRSYVESSVDQNTLLVLDSRIYKGTLVWIANDKNYVDSASLEPIILASGNESQNLPIKTVFVECVSDDCGWGTVKDQPEFNESVEKLVSIFASLDSSPKIIYGGGGIKKVRGEEENKETPAFKIYEETLSLNPDSLGFIEQTHNHFFYHIPRDEYPKQAFDYYEIQGGFDKAINIFSYGVLCLAILIAIISVLLPFYLLFPVKKFNFYKIKSLAS